MSHVWGLFSHPDREMQVINRENETISHHYTHHVLLMAAIPVICAFIGTTQIGWNFGDGYSAAIFLIPICISFDTAEKRRYATYLILNRRFSFEF